MTDEYYSDYPTRPIGGGNPYYCCAHCGRSDPEINGRLEGHAPDCEYRLEKENPYYGQLIVAAAIKEGDLVRSVPRPGRHHTIIRAAMEAGLPTPITGEQGFLTSDGEFVGRKTAMRIALAAGQEIIRKEAYAYDGGPLFSEDLW